ncbi:MAG: hypothetical protein QNJ92_07425 [Alphaproteobacteria bacterium]|nr:hypothetical protein [Alphaproteobacteria bacterium]
MDLVVHRDGTAMWGEQAMRAALGRSGITLEKREGDGASPAGRWAMRRVLYRADRVGKPVTPLPVAVIAQDDGWCDAPDHEAYNQPVTFPFGASAERLWRDDHLYDVIVVLSHNEPPVAAHAGSAIFLHVARPDYGPTEGCAALALDDLLHVLSRADRESAVRFLP